MGLLADVFSYGDSLKRKVRGLLDDPAGTVDLGVKRFAEDQSSLQNLFANAYPLPGDKTVLNTPQQRKQMQAEAADKALKMYGGLLGATVWHGSPHKFDKFDSSKIGTGEGAQAYGHGLYLAESPAVAKSYQDALAKGKQAGSLYKVDLPDDAIAKMLDWDKPLSQQADILRQLEGSEALQEAMRAGGFTWRDASGGLMEGRHMLAARRNGSALDSERLRKAGIPGIRYLDGGSRGAGGGTSNYVVFPGNEGLLQILERNGQALK